MAWPVVAMCLIEVRDTRFLGVASVVLMRLPFSSLQFAERASYYGCKGVFNNFITRFVLSPIQGPNSLASLNTVLS
jgi:hypothetical protein